MSNDDESLIFVISNGIEVDFSFDHDGDLLVQVTDDRTQAFYLNDNQARQLRDYLNRRL